MSKGKCADQILEVISQLRKRKARPDADRICQLVKRRHGVKADQVKAELLRLVKDKIVAKVDFKGSVSYRRTDSSHRRQISGVESPTGLVKKLDDSLESESTGKNHQNSTGKSDSAIRSSSLEIKKPGAQGKVTHSANDAGELPSSTNGEGMPLADDSFSSLSGDSEEDDDDEMTEESIENLISDRPSSSIINKEVTAGGGNAGGIVTGGLQMTVESEAVVDNVLVGMATQLTTKSEDVKESLENTLMESGSRCGRGRGRKSNSSLSASKRNKCPWMNNRRKRIKKMHDTDSESCLTVKRARLTASSADVLSKGEKQSKMDRKSSTGALSLSCPAECSFCLHPADKNKFGQREELLVCKDCHATAHPSCMEYSVELALRASRSPWQCSQCKTCNVCDDSGDGDAMLFCDSCDKGYHMDCHTPPIKEKPVGKWVCCQCTLQLGTEGGKLTDGDIKPSTETDLNENHIAPPAVATLNLPTPSASPIHFQMDSQTTKLVCSPSLKVNGEGVGASGLIGVNGGGGQEVVILDVPKLSETLRGDVPDATNWSVLEVVQFFTSLGYVQQAERFKDQEVDGKALLLMTRADVLTGMSIKLGPALKIYAHVQRLQAHVNNR